MKLFVLYIYYLVDLIPGYYGYYVKPDSFDKRCITMYYPNTENTTTYYSRIENNTIITYKNDFGSEFNSEYSAVWRGYIKLDYSDTYQFSFNHTDSIELSIGNDCYFLHARCEDKMINHLYELYMDKGLYPFSVAYTNNFYEPFFSFSIKLNNETIPLQLYHSIFFNL